MEKEKINRINELAHIARERELSEAELEERAALRKQYIDEFRENTRNVLDNVVIQTPDGKRHKLPKKNS